LVFRNGTYHAIGSGGAHPLALIGGAGIGPGASPSSGSPSPAVVHNLTILKGNINASGHYGAGIGCGPASGAVSCFGFSTVSTLSVFNGNISAIAEYAAGIGSEYTDPNGTSTVDNLTIVDGNIEAAGWAAGVRSWIRQRIIVRGNHLDSERFTDLGNFSSKC
jgi:hypothetical protein